MKVTVFKNEQFGEIRTIMREGQPWFIGQDVTKIEQFRVKPQKPAKLGTYQCLF